MQIMRVLLDLFAALFGRQVDVVLERAMTIARF